MLCVRGGGFVYDDTLPLMRTHFFFYCRMPRKTMLPSKPIVALPLSTMYVHPTISMLCSYSPPFHYDTQKFKELSDKVSETGNVANEILDLEERFRIVSERSGSLEVDRVQADLQQIRSENSALIAQIQQQQAQ
jgi:hypothetical protein